MVARSRERRMNIGEALAEIFADRDSDVSGFSDNEFEPSVSEEFEEEDEEDEGEEDESGESGRQRLRGVGLKSVFIGL